MATREINISILNGSNGFRLDGENKYDESGYSVSDAGDVNGDGFDDVIVGAPFADPSGIATGASYVVFGRVSGFDAAMNLSSLDGSNGFRLNGQALLDQSGRSVSSAGDVNGDGFDDVIVGAPVADSNGDGSGASYVVFGKAGGFNAVMDLSSLDGSNGFRLDGVAKYDASGISVSGAGDVNGDGFDDVIVGTPLSNISYVVFGKVSGFDPSMNLSSLDGHNGFRLHGLGTAGALVSGAGDVNGDGFDDVMINAPLAHKSYQGYSYSVEGASYVVFGKASGFDAEMDFTNLDGTNGFEVIGGGSLYGSRTSISGAGDINGDGFDDVVVGGATGQSVIFGKHTGFEAKQSILDLDGSDGFRLVARNSGGYQNDISDGNLSNAGDVNGDGFDDLIFVNKGFAYVVFGRTSGFEYELNLFNLDGKNGFSVSGFGDPATGAGDVNGDGFDDLIMGAPSADLNGDQSGSSYIFFGSRDFGQDGSLLPEIKGTDGDDMLRGSRDAEHFIAGGGNDNLLGVGGADVFDAGAGDDAIRIGDLTFASIDGGDGNDALHLAGSGMNLDLSVLGDQIHNIETICIYGRGDNTLTLDADSLLNLSDSTDTLKVHGNTGDHIVLQDSGWVDGGSHGFYHIYTHDDAVLLVGANLAIEFV